MAETNCSNCAAPLVVDAKICRHCDTPVVAPEAERRVVNSEMGRHQKLENVELRGDMNRVEHAVNCVVTGDMNRIKYATGGLVLRGSMNKVRHVVGDVVVEGTMNTVKKHTEAG